MGDKVTIWDAETGQAEEVDEAIAAQRFREGTGGFVGGRVAFRDRNGTLGWVRNDRAAIADALDAGYTLANREATEKDELAAAHERDNANFSRVVNEQPGGLAAATAIGFVRGGTFGLADFALDALNESDDPQLRTMGRVAEAVQEEHPIATTVGDVAGTIGTAIPLIAASGPVGAEAAGARLAGAAARFGPLSGQLAQRALYAAGRDAVIDMAITAPREAVNLYRDPDATAQDFLAAVGQAGAFGALFGGTFEAGGALLGAATASSRKAMSEGVQNWWARTFGTDLAPEAEREVSEALARSAELARAGQLADDGSGLTAFRQSLSPNVRNEVINYDARTADRAERIVTDLERADEVFEGVADFRMSPERDRTTIRTVQADPTGPSLDHIRHFVIQEARDLRARGSRIVSNPTIYDGPGTVARGNEMMTVADDVLRWADNITDPAEQVALLNLLKNRTGSIWRRTRNSPDAQGLLEEAYERQRLLTENADIVGRRYAEEIGAFNRDLTASIRADHGYNRAVRSTQVMREARPIAPDLERMAPEVARARRFAGRRRERDFAIDSQKVTRLVRGAGTDEARTLTDNFVRASELRRRVARNTADWYDLPPSEQRLYQAADEAMGRVQQSFTDQINAQVVLNQVRAIDAQDALGYSLAGGVIGGALGGAAAAQFGSAALVGGAVAASYRGRSAARQLTLLNRMQTMAGIERFVKRIRKRFEGVPFLGRLNKAARRGRPMRRLRPPRGTAQVVSFAAFQRATEQVRENMRDPEAMNDRLLNSVRDLDAQAPEVAQAIMRRGALLQRNLATRMPANAHPRQGLISRAMPGKLVSPTDRARFMRYYSVATDPALIMGHLEGGTLTRDHVDAIKDNYPAIYRQLVRTVVSNLAELAEEGVVPSYQDRTQLSQLLGVPLDPSLQPAFVARMQGRYLSEEQASAPQPQTRPPGNAPRSGSVIAGGLSETQRLSLRRSQPN